jgi:uncharacterized protein YdhG (YjbR/CyaY superfamily)
VAKKRFKSTDEYIASKPNDVRMVLERVRAAIRHAIPAAEEGMSYQIPVFILNGVPVLYFAGWKAHYSLYPMSDALVAAFERELASYERSKGTLRLPLSEPVRKDLIGRLAKFRADQLTKRDQTPTRSRRLKGREGQLDRLRRICATLPSVSEKLSHGTPTFFVEKDRGVFAMFADGHYDDSGLAVWVPVKQGLQPLLIEEEPATYFKPPYVGSSGWVGIDLSRVRDDTLQIHLREAWQLVARKQKTPRRGVRR